MGEIDILNSSNLLEQHKRKGIKAKCCLSISFSKMA